MSAVNDGGGNGVRTRKVEFERGGEVGMTDDIHIAIDDIRAVGETLDLAALFFASSETVGEVDGIQHLAMTLGRIIVLPKPEENNGGIRGVFILELQLAGHQPRHIDPVGFVMTGLMVAAHAPDDLRGNWREKRGDGLQLIHR